MFIYFFSIHTPLSRVIKNSSIRGLICRDLFMKFFKNFLCEIWGGFICLLLRIQTAVLAFVLTGVYFPTYSGGRIHLFGWQVNLFNEEYRKKLLLFMNIYDPQVADETEGIEMLRARVVSWPTNTIKKYSWSLLVITSISWDIIVLILMTYRSFTNFAFQNTQINENVFQSE